MDAVDGNAIGGLLIDVFGTEMTAAGSTCGTCGASRPVAQLVVYQRAPGTVVRCRTCGSVLMVFVKTPDEVRINLAGLASLGDSQTSSTRAGRTWTQPRTPGELAETNTEGAIMSHEEPMSMGTPDEESMSMDTPQEEESMSMDTPQEDESMSMGTPGEEESMSMGTPDESM